MIASRRRGQGGLVPGLQDQDIGRGVPDESFWSSFSVVESLFSDDQGSLRGNGESLSGNGGSRLPFMRQLKSQEAFPPLPPSSAPYEESTHHHGSSHRRGNQQRRGSGSGEWITPHTHTTTTTSNNLGSNNNVGQHLFSPLATNGQNYYNAFNGYNQHFAMPVNDGHGDLRHSGGINGSTHHHGSNNSFSVFSDYQPRQQLNGGVSLGQNAFTAVPDIGVSVERHQQVYYPRGASPAELSSPNVQGYISPSAARKRAAKLTTTSTTIIAPPAVSPYANGKQFTNISSNNKICCDEKALLEEDSQLKGLPFSLLLALPNEHLLRIMSYLAGKDLVHLQMVGKKRLAVLATDNGLWKDLYLRRWKLLEIPPESSTTTHQSNNQPTTNNKRSSSPTSSPSPPSSPTSSGGEESDEWAWIHSLLQQNERWKDIFQSRHSAERWRIGTLKMFNGCWGFISQHAPDSGAPLPNGETLDIFFHRKDIAPEGDWYEDWWLKDTPGVSRSQKCGYWDTFLCGRVVRYKQRAAYAQGRRPQACNISFVGEERRERIPSLQYGVGGTLITPEGMVLPPTMRFASPTGN